MKKGQSSLTTVVIVAVLVLLIFGGYYIWQRNAPGNGGNNNSTSSQSGWKSYTWGTLVFQYPPDWRVDEIKYATPAQTAAGEAPTTVGLTVYPNNESATSSNVISIGGRQTECVTLPKSNLKCATFYDLPVYTKSADLNVVGVYNQLLPTITHDNSNDDFKISAPAHIAVWNGGQTYSIDWVNGSTVGTSTTKVNIEIWNTSASQKIYTKTATANNGSLQFAVPNARAASSTLHYVHIWASQKVSATTTKIFNGWSDPFYIQASGPTTGNSTSTLPQVVITSPIPNSKITSPLTITGKAMNPWYFEASFPIKLLSATGSVLAQTNGQAQTDWMQSGVYIPFKATLTFTKPTGSNMGTLVFMNDNPSGDPSKQIEFKVPIKF